MPAWRSFQAFAMRQLRIFLLGSSLAFCAIARGVYAPIPEEEKGKGLTLSLITGITYNNNIFGSPTDPVASVVYEVSPKVDFNSSLSQLTFFSATFQPRLDYFGNRPGSKALYSQDVGARIAHSFSPLSVVDVSDAFAYDQDPQVLLNGVPVNTNQTLESNQLNAKYTFAPAERLGLALKTRIMYYDYVDDVIGDQLNRFENLYGLEFDYSLLPELKLAGEYRHLDVDYRNDPSENDKHSDFLMAGFDYKVGPRLTASFRVGGEYTHRDSLSTETTPYVEFAWKYDYAQNSFISAGYTYDLEETSNPFLFSDEKVNRVFVNLQHAFTGLIVGSAAFDYEPATLLGRNAEANLSEDTTHAGAAVTYLPSRSWKVSLTYDYDYVESGISSRGLNRSQAGVRAVVAF